MTPSGTTTRPPPPRRGRATIGTALALFTLACAHSAEMRLLGPVPPAPAAPLRVAVSPATSGGTTLTERVASRLSARGVAVVLPSGTLDLLRRHKISIVDSASPHGLGVLRAEGIDVLLTVEAVPGWDSNPDSAVWSGLCSSA